MSTYVLLHGAWHGGGSWGLVRNILKKNGHRVYTPTMIGLSERKHLLSTDITMGLLVEDIANVLINNNLEDVILVGHSFGGAVISGVFEHVPERIAQLVYFDAAILENGESMFDCMPNNVVLERLHSAQKTSGGISLPVPTAAALGGLNDKQWQYLTPFLTPHPLSSYKSELALVAKPGKGIQCCYIVCNEPVYQPLEWARMRAEKYNWPLIYIKAGHEAMVTMPEKLSDILMNLSQFIDKNFKV